MKKHTPIAAIALLAIVTGSAQAASPRENDGRPISAAKIGLADAVTTAEDHVGGTASHAAFEQSQGRAVFDVEVVADHQVVDVKVDASNGKVLSSQADRTDQAEESETEQDD